MRFSGGCLAGLRARVPEAVPVACNGTGLVDGLQKTMPTCVARRGLSHRSGVSLGKRNGEMLSRYGNWNGRRCRSLGGNLIERQRIRKPLRGRKNQLTGSRRKKFIRFFVSLHSGRHSSFVSPSLLDCSAHLAGRLTAESFDDGNPQRRTARIIQEHPGPGHCLQGSPRSSNNGEHCHDAQRMTNRSEHVRTLEISLRYVKHSHLTLLYRHDESHWTLPQLNVRLGEQLP